MPTIMEVDMVLGIVAVMVPAVFIIPQIMLGTLTEIMQPQTNQIMEVISISHRELSLAIWDLLSLNK